MRKVEIKMKFNRKLLSAIACLLAFAVWTVILCSVDRQAIGPCNSIVGLANINLFVHQLTGVHLSLYVITDWLSIIPLGICTGFATLGAVQWIRRKKLAKVDHSILVLGGFYLLVAAAYLLFEVCIINYRPVLLNGVLEASYPSSTTVLALCAMISAMLRWKHRISNSHLRRCVLLISALFTAFMVIARLLSGVHWFSDIIGGILLSAGLLLLYDSISQ